MCLNVLKTVWLTVDNVVEGNGWVFVIFLCKGW